MDRYMNLKGGKEKSERERAAGIDGTVPVPVPVNQGVGSNTSQSIAMDAERMREIQISIAASSAFPGFRFSPTDEELISYYLKKKYQGCDDCVDIIPEVDFCRHEPWDLPAISIIKSESEWFFFSARGRKYPNGSQSRRATESGYWKATGKERNVKSGSTTIGTKRTLVFHTGRAPKGERTEWIMHEYCMNETSQDSLVVCRLRRNSDFRINVTPRDSLDQRHFPASEINTLPIHEYGIQQIGTSEGAKAVESCSKECTSSNSHVEQNDSGSDYDQRLINESPRGSCSHQKDGEDEDDCFADIMKDDIVKLDESSLSIAEAVLPLVVKESEARMKFGQLELAQGTMSPPFPSQGTTGRRIRLRRKPVKVQQSQGKPSEEDKHDRSSRCVITLGTDMVDSVVHHRSVSMFLVIMTLLLLVFLLVFEWWPSLGRWLQLKWLALLPGSTLGSQKV